MTFDPYNSAPSTAPIATASQVVRVMQIIKLALIVGPLVFLGVAIVIHPRPESPTLLISAVLAAVAAQTIMARLIVPRLMATATRRELAQLIQGGNANPALIEQKLYAAAQTQFIVSSALIEGATFMVITAYVIEGHAWTLGIAVPLLLFQVLDFPTAARVDAAVRTQIELLSLEAARPPA